MAKGEIKGSADVGGKIGGGNVDFYLREENLDKLYVNEKNFINKLKDDDTMDLIIYGKDISVIIRIVHP